MKRLGIYILMSVLFISCSEDNLISSSEISIQSVKTYGGSKNDGAQSIISTMDGGFAIIGFTQSNDGDITDKQDVNYDIWLLKFSSEGTLQWQKTYGGSSVERGYDLVQTNDGGFALIGYTLSVDGDVSSNNGSSDQWLLKLNNQGNIIWEQTYGFGGDERGFSIVQTQNGGFFTGGYLDFSASGGQGNSPKNNNHGVGEYWGHLLDASGNVNWRRYFGGTNNDRTYDVLQTNDLGFLMVGASESTDFNITNNKGSYDYWVVKTEANGNLQWTKSFGGSEQETAFSIAKTLDGNYILAGNTYSSNGDIGNNTGNSDAWLVKINGNGAILWEQNYGGSVFETTQHIIATADGGFVIAGNSRSSDGHLTQNSGQNDCWIFKIDANGNLQWSWSVGGSGIDELFGITELANGNFVAVGESTSNDGAIPENKGFSDLIIIQLKYTQNK